VVYKGPATSNVSVPGSILRSLTRVKTEMPLRLVWGRFLRSIADDDIFRVQ